MNSTITIEVPKWTEKEFSFTISNLVRNYSAEQIEDMFLNWLIEENKKNDEFVSEEEVFKSFKN